MTMTKLFSFKMGLIALGLLALLWMLPESLISSQGVSTDSKQMLTSPLPLQQADTSLSAAPEAAQTPLYKTPPKTYPKPKPLPPPKTPNTTHATAPSTLPIELQSPQRPTLITQAILLSLMSLLPFAIMILTSFLKVVVVLSLLRTALGVQQAPPNQVINGVAFLLSLFIMYPTAARMYDATKPIIAQTQAPDSLLSPDSSTYVIAMARAAAEPMREFLKKNSSPKHHAIFYRLAYRGLPEEYRESLKPDDFIVLIPAYITGQLKDAFEIGVLIYIPFFVIDLVTSNILLAMGMMMLSPVTISMPLKLFLLVMLDGWTILIEGLVKTFQ